MNVHTNTGSHAPQAEPCCRLKVSRLPGRVWPSYLSRVDHSLVKLALSPGLLLSAQCLIHPSWLAHLHVLGHVLAGKGGGECLQALGDVCAPAAHDDCIDVGGRQVQACSTG